MYSKLEADAEIGNITKHHFGKVMQPAELKKTNMTHPKTDLSDLVSE